MIERATVAVHSVGRLVVGLRACGGAFSVLGAYYTLPSSRVAGVLARSRYSVTERRAFAAAVLRRGREREGREATGGPTGPVGVLADPQRSGGPQGGGTPPVHQDRAKRARREAGTPAVRWRRLV
jgi:hypothetical protein